MSSRSQAFPSVGAGDWLPFSQTLTQGRPATNTISTTSIFIQLIPRCQPFSPAVHGRHLKLPVLTLNFALLRVRPRLMGDSAWGLLRLPTSSRTPLLVLSPARPRKGISKISGDHQVVRPHQTHEDPPPGPSTSSTDPANSNIQFGGNNKHCLRSSSPLATLPRRRFWGRCCLLLWSLSLDIATRPFLGPRQLGQVPPWGKYTLPETNDLLLENRQKRLQNGHSNFQLPICIYFQG